MPVKYIVEADVIDLRIGAPRPDDRFLVDSNVWFWTSYSWASQTALAYQVSAYPPFLSKALASGGQLYRCNLSFAELAHSIERAELAIYNKTRPAGSEVETKEYRHNYPSERTNVVAEVQSAWDIVKTMAQPLDVVIDETTTDAALKRLPTAKVDGYDLFILEAMSKQGISQVITDDGDFSTVSGIQVFTANANVIALARSQGKFRIR